MMNVWRCLLKIPTWEWGKYQQKRDKQLLISFLLVEHTRVELVTF